MIAESKIVRRADKVIDQDAKMREKIFQKTEKSS
jgi:hypothetical protein